MARRRFFVDQVRKGQAEIGGDSHARRRTRTACRMISLPAAIMPLTAAGAPAGAAASPLGSSVARGPGVSGSRPIDAAPPHSAAAVDGDGRLDGS